MMLYVLCMRVAGAADSRILDFLDLWDWFNGASVPPSQLVLCGGSMC